MEIKKNYLSGGKEGKTKDPKLSNKYMESTINKIKTELKTKFRNNKKLYIYYKYNPEKKIFNIFVVFFNNYNYNCKSKDITYLITVGEEYPLKPPKVFCITDFHIKIDIFDMKNIQKNLIEQWKQKNTINDLISELLIFSDILVFQVENKLFPNIGEYYYNSYLYDLNDFLLNENNKFFRVFYFSSHENNYDINSNERFMIITKNTILFFSNRNSKLKNFCVMEFKFELTWIESIKNVSIKKYPNFIFFEILWNKHSNYLYKFIFGFKENKAAAKKMCSTISERKDFLLKNYKYFEKFNDNSVEILDIIISIKKHYLNVVFSNALYNQIHKLYRKIIEICNSKKEESYKKYVDKLQNFISKYENQKK